MRKINCIGVLTSGGDAPGMNAAIRAVTRTALFNHMQVKGIYHGYHGLINDDVFEFRSENVSNIIQRGGTILKTARCPEFRDYEGRRRAYDMLRKEKIDALVVIGGNGTFSGAREFGDEFDFPIVGVPGTIDNDLYGTDSTIGYDTALNTIVRAVDQIKDTAESHERLFLIEVMGRDAGFLALNGALATGSEAAVIPEIATSEDLLEHLIQNGFRKRKKSSIVLVSESDATGGAQGVAKRLRENGYEPHVTILGHVQRGGTPTASDRVLACRTGVAAVDALLEGQRGCMIGIKDDQIVYVPFSEAIKGEKPLDHHLIDILRVLCI